MIASRSEARDDAWQAAPVRVAWLLLVFWTGFLILYSVRGLTQGGDDVLIAAPRRVIVSVVGGLISWVVYLLTRNRATSPTRRYRLAWLAVMSVAAGTLFAAANSAIFYALQPLTGEDCLNGAPCTVRQLVDIAYGYSVNWTFLFAAWGLLVMWVESVERAVAADRRASEDREAARVAEIRALRYQVNPHFLFNCLNSLATLVRRPDTTEAQAMIGELGSFLRYGLATDPLTDVDLNDEVEMQRRYLALECRRFAQRLTVRIELGEGTERARVPALILQPLVENAIKHGVATTSAHTTISIRSRAGDGGRLNIVVEDDAWADPRTDTGADVRAGFGIGLRNVSERLAARFGDTASCVATRLPRAGFQAVLDLPLVID